jgi:hypothetical protein
MAFLAAVTIPQMIMGGVMAVGTAMSVAGSIAQGKAQSEGYKAQANAARYNQDVANQNAQAVRQAGSYQEAQQRIKNQKLMGQQEAAYGASGAVINDGSPLEVMAETASMMERDIHAQRYNTEIQARRYESQAGQYGFEASRDMSMSSYPVTAGYMTAGTTLLGNAYKYLSDSSLTKLK